MDPTIKNDEIYHKIRRIVREDTPSGTEPPRLTRIEIMLCEAISDARADYRRKIAAVREALSTAQDSHKKEIEQINRRLTRAEMRINALDTRGDPE